jgi:hypothetical protein
MTSCDSYSQLILELFDCQSAQIAEWSDLPLSSCEFPL